MTTDPARAPANSDILAPTRECDLIMKGGITSGVVFPLAIYELSRQFRFVNLGGTSAGGIAAAVAAAAEYNRAGGGFERIKAIPKELGGNLIKLFQPSPGVKPLFDILIAAIAKPRPGIAAKPKLISVPLAVIMGYKVAALIGALAGYLAFLVLAHFGQAGGFISAIVFTALGLIVALGLRLKRAVMSDLADNNYGLCTGATQDEKSYGHVAVTEWLADTIDECAGKKAPGQPGGRPLTFGDLKNPPTGKPIILEMMTTNLSMKRPYRLPFRDQTYLFRQSDIERLFPKRVVDYMLQPAVSRPFEVKNESTGEVTTVEGFFHVPDENDLPVIFATRLSLSFPILFSAIPLYACDFTLTNTKGPPTGQETPEEKETRRLEDKLGAKHTPRKCLFSDGGLSNNFPMQLFDELWPNRPTFGVGLDDYSVERDRDYAKTHTETRVWMPQLPQGGALLPIEDIGGVFAFFASIIYSAKDWQDNLQSTQQGYRERIVHVALKPDEGGLNLDMTPETIGLLSDYGAMAGDKVVEVFNLDDHRWRRFLVAMVRLESTLFELQGHYSEASPGVDSFKDFLVRYPPQAEHYKPVSPEWLEEMRKRAVALVSMAENWNNKLKAHDGKYPHPEVDLRITPKP